MSVYCSPYYLSDNNFYIYGEITNNTKIDLPYGPGSFGQKIDFLEEEQLQNYQIFYNKYINKNISSPTYYEDMMFIGGGSHFDINNEYYTLTAYYTFGFSVNSIGEKYTEVYTLDDANRTYEINEIIWKEDSMIYSLSADFKQIKVTNNKFYLCIINYNNFISGV